MKSRLTIYALATSAGVIALAPAAYAQSATAADTEIQEIVVTAQNRQQNVQDVPIAMTVVSGEQLESQGVTDFTAVQRAAPSLQITNDTNLTKVSIRGVGTLNHGPTADQSIAVNIDGEYINRPTILNAALFDLDRVEVLRGPQGTLYGRNSTGGAVNFITRKPGSDFAVNLSGTYGSYNLVTIEGGVDVPLGDFGAIRVSGIFTDRDGYFRHENALPQVNSYVPRDLGRSGDDHRWGGRVSLRLTPVAGLTIDAVYERVESRVNLAAQAWRDLNAAGVNAGTGPGCANGWVEVGPATPGTQCIPQNTNLLAGVNRKVYDSTRSGIGYHHQNSDAVRGRIAYDFGDISLTYTGGYRESFSTSLITLSPVYITRNYGLPTKTQSHELRLNGTTSGITWQTGVFLFDEKVSSNQGLYSPLIGPNGGYVNYFIQPVHARSFSAFGQVEVPLADQITAVGGVRYTRDKKTGRVENYGFRANTGLVELPASTSPVYVPTPFTPPPFEGDKITWLAGLNYEPNADTLIYAKVSTGYKGGGFDASGKSFQPETNTAYEAGAKFQFGPTSQHIFNVAGFYYDYTDLQTDILLNPGVGAQTFNAGKATIWGIEAEARFRLSRNDTFHAGVNYLHAKYDRFLGSYAVSDPANPSRTGLDVGDVADLSGNRIPQTPEWVITTGYDHRFDLGSNGSVTASVASRFKSKYFAGSTNYRDAEQKAYTQTDLSLEYKPMNGNFSVQAFVRNLEDVRPLTYAGYVAAAQDDIFNWQFGEPRTYGVRVSVNF
ncbi:MAG: TonB-dependent receptor [Alphaproteobacteria bacterium HGW-Alphaproteobacteria-16]|nr:MAG: TonB-dependent receptor [Alphaproteobacteria bacterium HGW-Alphaproteobacteria-16]